MLTPMHCQHAMQSQHGNWKFRGVFRDFVWNIKTKLSEWQGNLYFTYENKITARFLVIQLEVDQTSMSASRDEGTWADRAIPLSLCIIKHNCGIHMMTRAAVGKAYANKLLEKWEKLSCFLFFLCFKIYNGRLGKSLKQNVIILDIYYTIERPFSRRTV